jgi:threonine synthase
MGVIMNFLSHLQCGYCNKEFEANKLWNLCSDCSKPLLAIYDIGNAKKNFNKSDLESRSPTLWRYKEMLPIINEKYILSMGEGYTPLLKTKGLSNEIGFENLYIKEEGVNPTTSFKARGLCVAVSKAFELGVKEVSIPSAGNAAGAMSAYAALAGMKSFVYMPKDVPPPFIAECMALGAEVKLIDGVITDCGREAAEDVKMYKRFDLSTLKEPYRIEGKKTMGYEIAEQFNWELPDVIIYPTGGGTGLIGMWKAFNELEKLGWINAKRPRMVTVQATGCAPMVKAFNEGKEFADYWQNSSTIADGLRVPSAVGDFLILRSLRESNGTAVAISDEKMIEGIKTVGRTQGLFISPEGGATYAAFLELLDSGWIAKDEKVVLFNTGSGHKYFDVIYNSE